MELIERNERAIFAIDILLQSVEGKKMSESVLVRVKNLLKDNIDFIKTTPEGIFNEKK